ncbi:hypothetical protein LTR66_005532, partial [Elasticomyces elasticus]
MAAVYGNSYVTLAATRASDGNGGLFDATPDAELLVQTPGTDGFKVHARRMIEHPMRTWLNPNKYPLLTRSWVFQERLLSPRVLHFVNQELMWECKTCMTCECGWLSGYYQQGFISFKERHSQALQGESEHDLQIAWRAIVEEYGPLKLTVSSDRLPALSGVARTFQALKPATYLAGLWRDSLVHDMTWRTLERKTRPEWRAPSWSWASVDSCQIDYPFKPRKIK